MDVVKKDGTTNIATIGRSDSSDLAQIGEKSLKTNRFFQFIDLIMSDSTARSYVDEFFSDWDDIKTSVMFMKTYQIIDKEISAMEKANNAKMDPLERRQFMIGFIKELISNTECRGEIVKNMHDFMDTSMPKCKMLISKNVSRKKLLHLEEVDK